MAEFESFAQVPGFRPRAIVDTAGQVRAQVNKELEQMREFFNSRRITDQQRIEDAKFAGQNWKALASLTESGMKLYSDVKAQEAKDKLTGEMWDSILNPEYRSADFETPFINEAERQNIVAKAQADGLEADGDLIGSELVRKRYQGLGQGITDERAKAQKLKTTFPSQLTAFVNSETMVRYQGVPVPINMLYNSGDYDRVNFALNTAASRILERENAQFMTKDTLVKYLGEVVPSTVGYMATNQLTQTIAQQKDERLSETKAKAYNAGVQSTPADATQNFQEYALSLFNDNNGVVTIQRANRLAAESMLLGAASISEEQVRIIGKAEQRPGEPNTAIKFTNRLKYQEALVAARAKQRQDDAAFYSQLKDDTAKMVRSVTSIEDKTAAVEDSAKKLEARGMYQEAQELRADAGKYVVPPEALANYLRLEERQATGKAVTESEIQAGLQNDTLTPSLARQLRTQRREVFKEGLESAKNSQQISTSLYTARLKNTVGGEYNINTGEWTGVKQNLPVSTNQLRAITKSYQKDLQTDLNNFALTLPLDMDIAEKNERMSKRAQAFYKEQVEEPTGKYYLGGLLVDPEAVTSGTQAFENVRNAANQFGGSTIYAPTALPSGNIDYSDRWNPGQGVSQEIKNTYKPGDRLYDISQIILAKNEAEQAVFNRDVIQAAKDLGMTPKRFLDQQVASWGLDPINWSAADMLTKSDEFRDKPAMRQITGEGTPKLDPAQQDPGKMGFRLTAVTGIPTLLSKGFSIQASSSWSAFLYLMGTADKKDYFKDNASFDMIPPSYIESAQNANMTYRTLAGMLAKSRKFQEAGYTAGDIINYAATLEQLYGIK